MEYFQLSHSNDVPLSCEKEPFSNTDVASLGCTAAANRDILPQASTLGRSAGILRRSQCLTATMSALCLRTGGIQTEQNEAVYEEDAVEVTLRMQILRPLEARQ